MTDIDNTERIEAETASPKTADRRKAGIADPEHALNTLRDELPGWDIRLDCVEIDAGEPKLDIVEHIFKANEELEGRRS